MLHVTVTLKLTENKYFYNFSHGMTHNFIFTGTAVKNLILQYLDLKVIRFKKDKCAAQCKSKKVFASWKNFDAEIKRPIVIYYWVAGHGEGLVDVSSGFGVKDPLRKAIIIQDWFFNSSSDIAAFLGEKMGSERKCMSTYKKRQSRACMLTKQLQC